MNSLRKKQLLSKLASKGDDKRHYLNLRSLRGVQAKARPGDIAVFTYGPQNIEPYSRQLRLATGSEAGHVGMIGRSKRGVNLVHLVPKDDLKSQPMSEYLLKEPSTVKIYRPQLSAKQRAEAVSVFERALEGKPKLVYRDLDNKALIPGELAKNLTRNRDSFIANQVSKLFGGISRPGRNCLGGNCAWLPGFAYNPQNPDVGAKALGIRGTRGLYTPADYEHAFKRGKLDLVAEYTPLKDTFSKPGLVRNIVKKAIL